MPNPLVRKLENFVRLSEDDKATLVRISAGRIRRVEARRDIIREGEAPREVYLILSGWACRYKELPDARRQIVSFFLPGDLCDLNIHILREMDHTVGALTPVTCAVLTPEAFTHIMTDHPRVTQALWWESLVHAAIQREWALSLGRRDAMERVGHLFCELFLRLRAVGMASGLSCPMPLTQADIAEATGITSVHVNRTIQQLRKAGLIALQHKTLTVPDLEALQGASYFNPNYLHLGREGAHLDANR